MARKSRKDYEAAMKPTVPLRKVYNVGVYVRLSVMDKKQKGDSIETQQAIIREFISEHSNMELREVYIDNGHSGQSFERPAFLRMKNDIENGLINCCITKDLSRLGRNAIDTGFYIESYFPKHGVRYIAITDNYDSADGQSGGIMVSLKNMVNEAIALEAGRKIRAYHQMLNREGGFSGPHPPYGYLKDSEDCHKLVPDKYAGAIVRQIYEMYLSGEGVTAILDWLNTSGILPPKRYFHSIGVGTGKLARENELWGVNNIKSILRNRVYCGDIVRGKNKTTNYVKEKKPETDWFVTVNKHEAIISRELFDRVQEIRSNINTSQNKRYDTQKIENIFKGKISCGHCGRYMERQRVGEYIYKFRCPTRYSYAKTACVPVLINEVVLKEKLLDMLRFFNLEIPHSHNDTEIERGKAELLDVQAERRNVQNLLDGLYESLIAKDITDAEYKELKNAYASKMSEVVAREKLLRQTGQAQITMCNMLTKAKTSLEAAKNGYDLTTDIVDGIVEKIKVFDDKSLMVKFMFRDGEIPSREVVVYE